ncbi:MAG: Stp1/IreP family PP2C-type Ser/Thr phosphatase [Anaerolineae bacterium]|nr:Stp1/IreP family PP2C-type Ser/Thr phosphatase [Anaerolineae bacterium]
MKARNRVPLLLVGLIMMLSACNNMPWPDSVAPEMPSRLLATTLAVGLLLAAMLLVAVVLLFVLPRRRPQVERVEEPENTSTSETPGITPLDALPERTLLGQGRYRVLNVSTAAETLDEVNIYTARGTTPLSRCPQCNAPIVGEDMQSCAHCGADLSGITLIYPKFLVRETIDAQTFEVSAQLAALRLRHPALIVPEDVFTETIFEPPRHYRVEPVFKHAQEVPLLPPAEKVLRWGIALAQGMAYLHQHYVTLQKVDLEHIVVGGEIARHVCIDNVALLPREAQGKADIDFAENVRALAGTLLSLLQAPDAAPPTGAPVNGAPSTGAPSTDSAPASDILITLLQQAQQTGKTADVFAAVLEGALRGLHEPEKVHVQIGVLTDVGRLRALNEDSVLTLDLTERFAPLGLPVGVCAVADGMGGHAAGDVASQLTVQTLQEAVDSLYLEADGELPDARVWLEKLVVTANQAVYTERQAADNDMGCTLVLALMIGRHATIANIGDSRAYWLSADGPKQITTDHSLVERLVAAGHITAQEARQHPRRNVIYRVVGDKSKADYDLFEQVLAPGEALLLCSDGLSGMLPDSRIWTLWDIAPSPQAACEQLVEAANQAGGTDNISVVIVQVDAVGAS